VRYRPRIRGLTARGGIRPRPGRSERSDRASGELGGTFRGNQADGFPKNGGATREVLFNSLNEQMKESLGLDFGISPTQLVELENDNFTGGRLTKPKQVGALQTFVESDGQIINWLSAGGQGSVRENTAKKKSIRKEDYQKFALLDFMTLNLDRGPENLLIK